MDPTTFLLRWYDRHHRVLPWRVTPVDAAKGDVADPYRVWLSEIMLQQTTVEAVKSYFLRFIERWPTVRAMAKASEDDILRAWAGLGYYSRARNLKKCADIVVAEHGGEFPKSAAGLKELPGIGDYTSAAIAAIAFGEQVAVVDGNVERVISRLYAIDTPLPVAKAQIRALMGQMTPPDRPGDFAQAMMDLGATICTPRRPACALCPLNKGCIALCERDPEDFPVKAPKAEKPVRTGAAFIAIAGDGSVYLRKRKGEGLLAGMTEVPGSGWTARIDGDATLNAAPFSAAWTPSGTITHVFTHFELRLSVYRASNVRKQAANEGWWSTPEELCGEALPTVMKKAIAAAIPDAFKRGRKSR
ncbi:A/G-specific adenine glycosylase [Brucella melitensis]|uniref:A/G-specific adenine glycosylase n=1 Tax=Brucella melitensis TaxID=29459 RepID=UPI000F5D2343|nr:A/G-specific adenine glycosylase [Brucella melitensis]AZH15351.1 A/G-specific adenine glycosylase [Brucella melitensis]MWC02266.1 A/G-specific adenine glycosylase [Brucella melitensis]